MGSSKVQRTTGPERSGTAALVANPVLLASVDRSALSDTTDRHPGHFAALGGLPGSLNIVSHPDGAVLEAGQEESKK